MKTAMIKGISVWKDIMTRELSGKNGVAIVVHDAAGHPILAKMNDSTQTVDGRTLILNIDRRIQFVLEEQLKEGMKLYGAKSATGAVMDPKTGAILAMASFPTFDPSSYADYSDDLYLNPFITSTYEPGSTFKPIVMSSALNAGLVKPDTECNYLQWSGTNRAICDTYMERSILSQYDYDRCDCSLR